MAKRWNWNATVVEEKSGARRVGSASGEVEAPTREAAHAAVRRDIEGKGSGRTAFEVRVF
ncbi:hypothetical protein [Streptomyces nigrescens]|uniref:Uncharacterized protein n=1 Tax=Streptomyces nigrescens TaxID=1920 RepID=A0A640TAM8_STRNI|nr:hypothetical protein [Streptomyces libani]WAT94913.1 hypothetical protein STRLI_000585 [Streptomyces libani subsp. libani]GFE20062.1 hypothetical protein Sliba_05150 [Streptomyces libani subsp. libani]GGV85719.1 hypothetical protein GCM10010500_02680 [Streptomyces libani subsp. libani]